MEKLIYGLLVAVIGMIIVFAGLLMVIIAIKIISFVVGKLNGKPETKSVPAPVKASAPAAKPGLSAEQSTVIAISAAVAAAMGVDAGKVKIRSIRKIIPNG